MAHMIGITVAILCLEWSRPVQSFSSSPSSNKMAGKRTNPFLYPLSSVSNQSPRHLPSSHNGRNLPLGLPRSTTTFSRRAFDLRVSLRDDEISVDSQRQKSQPVTPFDLEHNFSNNDDGDQDGIAFDRLLSTDDPADINLSEAVSFLQSHPNMSLTKSRWSKIFKAIEERTALADESEAGVNTRQIQQEEQQRDAFQPLSSQARKEMTDMYQTLHQLQHLRLFGAVSTIPPPLNNNNMDGVPPVLPAMGSDQVSPSLLETITGVSMTALTPKPSNSVLLAGGVLAVVEVLASLTTGISFNFLAFMTVLVAFMDRLLLNGAVLETFVKIMSPQLQSKIVRHEAGHFLCAYLLGCPVEGCVLSAWAALQDARFGLRRNSVSAGTSFFDPILSQQIHNHISNKPPASINNNSINGVSPAAAATGGVVTKSSVNRYSIIVMAGIAAEAMQYGQADGGASDEFALVNFLSQLNRRGNAVWNDLSIRNQARWGALQAILMLRQYKPCYDALVEALERGASLGECVYAIEKAGREANLTPLIQPLGNIVDRGMEQQWNTLLSASDTSVNMSLPSSAKTAEPVTEKASIEELAEYRKLIEQRLHEIESKLEDI